MTEIKNQNNEFFYIKDLGHLFFLNWGWFILSILLSVAVAFVYLSVTPPIYMRSTSVLINNSNSKNGSNTTSNINTDVLGGLGVFKPNSDINKEIHVFKSPHLMEIVVKRLKLDYDYKIKYKNIRLVDLYNDSPVLVECDSILQNISFSFAIKILSANKIELSDVKINEVEMDKVISGKLSEPINFAGTTITVKPNVNFDNNSEGKVIFFSKNSINSVAKKYISFLEATISEDDTPIIYLSFTDQNPQRAENILNSLITAYNEEWIKDMNQIAVSTTDFIRERLNVIENELGDVDSDISRFKSSNLLPDVTAASTLYLSKSNTTAVQLATVQNQISMAGYISSYIVEATLKNQLLPANTGLESVVIESLIERYNTAMLQRNNLLDNSSEKNPVVADMSKSLNQMKEVIIRSVDDYISTLNIQLENIRRDEEINNKKLASNPAQAKYLLSVERQQKVKEALYLFLLQRREENALTQTFTAYNTKVLVPPSGSMSPTAPRRNSIIISAIIIGLLIPATIIFLIASLDTSVRGKEDFKLLNIPFLGELPLASMKRRKIWQRKLKKLDKEGPIKVVVAVKSRNIINEAFRNIRNNIDFIRPASDKGTVIMSTSLFPGSGKTFITTNIALSMAIKGARTIVVDVDLRKATFSKSVGSPTSGLSGYLAAKIVSIDKLIVKSEYHDSLDVLPAGKIPPNPSELILGDRFGEVISYLQSKYDYIFLDCPPVDIVSETVNIGAMSDMTLFVVRVGLFDRRMLPVISDIYKSGKYRNMGLILNDVDPTKNKYGYGKYGYGKYGYGNEVEDIS